MASPQTRFGKAPSFRRATLLLLLVLAICTVVTISPMFPGAGVSAQSGNRASSGPRISGRPQTEISVAEPSVADRKGRIPVGVVDGGQGPIAESAIAQINALVADKKSRTAAQKKMDPNLIYASRMAAGRAAAPGVATLETGVEVKDGFVEVDIRTTVNDEMLSLVKKLGGEVVNSFAGADSITARMPLASLETLAGDGRVRHIGQDYGAITNAAPKPVEVEPAGPPTREEAVKARRAEVRARLLAKVKAISAEQGADTNAVPVPGIRTAVAEGDVRHRARAARTTFDIDGTGLKVGVLSNTFNQLGGYAADVASGDLPGTGNPNGYTTPVTFAGTGEGPTATSGIDEGRAMLQHVHSILPGAQLYYATAFTSISGFANNICALGGLSTFRGAPVTGTVVPGGCDIIIDDVFYFAESGLHDGMQTGVTSPLNMAIVTQAVNDVTAAGKMYFSSAGNSGNVNDGTAGAWEGDFTPSAVAVTALAGAGALLNWNPTGTDTPFNNIVTGGTNFTMQWSDPLGGSANDYDIYVLNAAGTTVNAASTATQDGTQDPFESIAAASTTAGRRIAVALFAGSPRFMSSSINRGRLQFVTGGQTRGHSGAANAFGVAATPTSPGAGVTFPNPFAGTNVVETFSSDGPRRVFFDAANQPITPGNFLVGTGGGLLRQKPDVTAADGAPTTVPGFERFFGTSAAAPHAGAIAGLVKAAFIKNGVASPTPAQIRTVLQNTALDIEAAGVDRDSGVGILQAFQAVQGTGLAGGAGLDLGTVTTAEGVGSNANGLVEPGENGSLTVQLNNVGLAGATGVSATLSTTTPGVTVISSAPRTYGTIAQNASATNATPFGFALAPSFACGASIDFSLTLTYGGGVSGASPKTVIFRVPTGRTGFTVTNDLSATPSANGFYTAAVGNTTGRLTVTGGTASSSCATPQASPGASATGTRRFNAYTFTNSGASTTCVSVNLTPPAFAGTGNGNTMYSAAYTTFTPATPGTGYLAFGRIQFVAQTSSYSFNLTAGQSATVVVGEFDVAGVTGQGSAAARTYTLQVSGLTGNCQAVPAPTQTVVNSNVNLAVTGQNIVASSCSAQGYTNDIQLNATLTNTGATTLQNLAFVVTELRTANGSIPAQPYRLITADGATCTTGGQVGAVQSVVSPVSLLPGQSVNVTFTIAASSLQRLRFLFNVVGVDTGVGQRRTVEKSAVAPIGFDVTPNAFDTSIAVTKVTPSGNVAGTANASDRAAKKR